MAVSKTLQASGGLATYFLENPYKDSDAPCPCRGVTTFETIKGKPIKHQLATREVTERMADLTLTPSHCNNTHEHHMWRGQALTILRHKTSRSWKLNPCAEICRVGDEEPPSSGLQECAM